MIEAVLVVLFVVGALLTARAMWLPPHPLETIDTAAFDAALERYEEAQKNYVAALERYADALNRYAEKRL